MIVFTSGPSQPDHRSRPGTKRLFVLEHRTVAQAKAGHARYPELDRVSISALCIQLLPYAEGSDELALQDPLRAYYLDLSNLRDTREEDVQRLLESFWTRMQGGDEKRAALELFELDAEPQPLTLAAIKLRYRQLVSLHHPDRGGSTTRLQSINLAMEILQRYYR